MTPPGAIHYYSSPIEFYYAGSQQQDPSPDSPRAARGGGAAAALVLGELGLRDAEVSKALCSYLQDDDAALRLHVIRAVGKLRVEPALPQLLERIKDGGTEAEQAALAAARLGARGRAASRN